MELASLAEYELGLPCVTKRLMVPLRFAGTVRLRQIPCWHGVNQKSPHRHHVMGEV